MTHTRPNPARAPLGPRWRERWNSSDCNAIVIREGRARWRGARPFWLALAYASFLAVVLCWSYGDSQRSTIVEGATPMEALGTMARLGHQLFATLCFCQIGAWLLMAPILTASSISGERQKGLLEGLLLSRLSTSEVVRGKLASALSLIVLLQLAGLPVVAMCFLMGGVSPGEFIGAFAIQIATACCGAACGIASSASSRNNSDAASGAIGSVLLWILVTGFAYIAQTSRGYLPGINEGVLLTMSANPIVAMLSLLSPAASGPISPLFSKGLLSPFFALGLDWMVSVAGMALLSLWLLKRASQVLLRSPETFDQTPAMPAPSTSPLPASSIAAREEWYREEPRRERPQPAVRERWQMPILDRIVFGNAMMQRELSLLWRWRTLSDREVSCVFILGLMLFLVSMGGLLSLLNPGNGEGVWWAVITLYGAAGALLCAARPASSIAGEREGGVWQGLSLTLLSAGQIAGAKVFAPIVAALGYGVGAWIFLALAAWSGGISASVTVPSVILMLLFWAQLASWSAFAGTRSRVSAAALGWSLGTPLMAWLGAPLLLSLLVIDVFAPGAPLLLRMLHPVSALQMVSGGAHSGLQVLLAMLLHAGIAALLFRLSWRGVRASQAEKSRRGE